MSAGLLLRGAPLWLRAVALGCGWLGAALALNLTILLGVPMATLIESDARPEVGTLSESCALAGYDMPIAPTPAQAAAGEVLLRPISPGPLALLRVPECAREPTAIPSEAASVSILPGGRALFARLRPPEARYEWFLAPGREAAEEPVALAGWTPNRGMPVLLAGGTHAAWVAPRPSEQGYAVREPPYASVVVQELATGKVERKPISGVEAGGWRLLGGAGAAGPFVIQRDGPRRFVSLDGEARASGPAPAQPGPEHDGELTDVVLFERGWVGWDVYAEARRYVVAWDLAGGRGRVEEPRGRGITACAADPAGRFVAYSTSTNLNVGSVPDAVVLLRAADGVELFRRRLPRYARAQVALLAGGFFVWSDSSARPPRVRVLRLPEP